MHSEKHVNKKLNAGKIKKAFYLLFLETVYR